MLMNTMSRRMRRITQKPQSAPFPADNITSAEGRVVVDKRHLLDLAINTTSCAGCIASVRALLGQPLSELRMLKAIVDEDGTSALMLKDLYLSDRKKTAQLLETFPLSSVLKKVQPVGLSQRCQLHRRAFAAIGVGSSIGWYRGSGGHTHGADGGGSFVFSAGGNGGGLGGFGGGGNWGGRGPGPTEPWDWEEAWERMPHNLRVEVASVKASALEAAMHHVTESARFCVDCKHNVVQAHDIFMGKMELEGCENEEEYDEELFQPFGDRLDCRLEKDEKVLFIDIADVEDLIYWHESFSSQDFDSNSGGNRQRHAATLEQGQREVRSILGAVLLSQLRSVWHGHTAQVQAENYLFCLVVDAIRTELAARGAAPHDKAAADLISMAGRSSSSNGGRCSTPTRGASDQRRQKRRQKRKEKKRAKMSALSSSPSAVSPPKSPLSSSSSLSPSSSPCAKRDGNTASRMQAVSSKTDEGTARVPRSKQASGEIKQSQSARARVEARDPSTDVQSSGRAKGESDVSVDEKADTDTDDILHDGLEGMQAGPTAGIDHAGPGWSTGLAKAAVHGGFGVGGLAFQLGSGGDDEASDDDLDLDLITEMEQLKARAKSRSDIDFLRKTLRQNYELFISRRAGAVLH